MHVLFFLTVRCLLSYEISMFYDVILRPTIKETLKNYFVLYGLEIRVPV